MSVIKAKRNCGCHHFSESICTSGVGRMMIIFLSGLFEVSPRVGEALNTNFQMRATSGWSDPDGDALVFQFSYKTESDPSARYFSYSAQEDDSFTTQLPTGNKQLSCAIHFQF